MASISTWPQLDLRELEEHKLVGAVNYLAWKERMFNVLFAAELHDYVCETTVTSGQMTGILYVTITGKEIMHARSLSSQRHPDGVDINILGSANSMVQGCR